MFVSLKSHLCNLFLFAIILQFVNAGASSKTDCPLLPHVEVGRKLLYFGVHFKGNFFEAVNYCHSHGMRLLTVNNEEEHNATVQYIKNSPYKTENFWMSGNDLAEEGVFTWLSTGERLWYTNWIPNQPDNYNNNEDCVHFWVTYDFKWNDTDCMSKFYFICEKSDP